MNLIHYAWKNGCKKLLFLGSSCIYPRLASQPMTESCLLTKLVAEVVGYTGKIEWDTSKPNGTPRKLLDVSKATALGWTYKTELEDGIRLSYADFLNNPMRAER